jgi:hypothetical protein
MLNNTIHPDRVWAINQEPGIHSNFANSAALLLYALDYGWHIDHVELAPSWDQHGLVYLVNLHHTELDNYQQLVLPDKPFIADLLQENRIEFCSLQTRLQWVAVF